MIRRQTQMIISCLRGESVEIDTEDEPLLEGCVPYVDYRKTVRYAAVRLPRGEGKKKRFRLHRLILGVTDPAVDVDHVDHNGLNNRKSNLRACTRAENMRNARVREDNQSGYKGVSWHRQTGKWCAQIQQAGKRTTLGYFDSARDAAEAYNRKAVELFGEFACVNELKPKLKVTFKKRGSETEAK